MVSSVVSLTAGEIPSLGSAHANKSTKDEAPGQSTKTGESIRSMRDLQMALNPLTEIGNLRQEPVKLDLKNNEFKALLGRGVGTGGVTSYLPNQCGHLTNLSATLSGFNPRSDSITGQLEVSATVPKQGSSDEKQYCGTIFELERTEQGFKIIADRGVNARGVAHTFDKNERDIILNMFKEMKFLPESFEVEDTMCDDRVDTDCVYSGGDVRNNYTNLACTDHYDPMDIQPEKSLLSEFGFLGLMTATGLTTGLILSLLPKE